MVLMFQTESCKNLCPVCGYQMDDPARNYNICPSCGTEFGIHDVNASILELRQAWIETGPRWWSKTDPQPENWSPFVQLGKVVGGTVLAAGGLQCIKSAATNFPTGNEIHPGLKVMDWSQQSWGRFVASKPHVEACSS